MAAIQKGVARKGVLLETELQIIYPLSSTLLPQGFTCLPAETLPDFLRNNPESYDKVPYLADLAAVELAAYNMSVSPVAIPKDIKKTMVHPGLDLLEVGWQGLNDLFGGRSVTPVPGQSFILLVPGGEDSKVQILTPSNFDLLALKIVAEGIKTGWLFGTKQHKFSKVSGKSKKKSGKKSRK